MNTRLFIVAASCALLIPNLALGQRLEWIQQIGTPKSEYPPTVTPDGMGNVYVGGTVWGPLAGAWQGGYDPYLLKYDAHGNLVWGRQDARWGTSSVEDIVVDASGDIYIAEDGIGVIQVAKYDPSGAPQWRRTVTPPDFGGSVYGLAVDSEGNTCLGGHVYTSWVAPVESGDRDLLVTKHRPTGEAAWIRQLGTDKETRCFGVALDSSGNLFAAGDTFGSLFAPIRGKTDAILAKFTNDGELAWGLQFGGDTGDKLMGVATDAAGNVYVAGETSGSLFGPDTMPSQAMLAKYTTNGELLWGLQFGAETGDSVATDVFVDGQGNAYISGFTWGSLFGETAGNRDAFLAKCDAEGSLVWEWQFGTPAFDGAHSVGVDAQGNIFVGGETSGILGAESFGVGDAFVAKFVDLPPLDGDFDHDGDVDGADLLAWQRGASPSPLSADDFAVWQAAFGAATDPVAPVGVPEPDALACLFAAAFVGARCPRKRTRPA